MKKPQFNNAAGSDSGGAAPEVKSLNELGEDQLKGILDNLGNDSADNKPNPPNPVKPTEEKPVELLLEEDPANPDPANPDPAKPDPAKPDPANPSTDNTLLLTDYTEIAKELDLTEPEKIATKEALVAAYKSKTEAIYEEQRKKVLTDMTNLEGFSPEAQYYIHKVNTSPKDANFHDILDPGARFDSFIQMNNDELVAAHLRTAKVPETQIPKQIEDLKNGGELETMANEIRETLKSAQTRLRAEENEARSKFVQDRVANVLKQEQEFNNKVVDNILKTTTFEGFTVPEKTRKVIAARFQDPKSYRLRLSSDPDFVAQLIVKNELMAATLNQLRATSKAAGAAEQKRAEHEKHYNPDTIKKSGGTGGSGGGTDENDPFAALVQKHKSGQDVTIV